MSIVPPRDALDIAKRIRNATLDPAYNDRKRTSHLYFFDLNAISPARAREIADLFQDTDQGPQVVMTDGGIIGGPPKLKRDGTWSRPSIPLSGDIGLNADFIPLSGILNTRFIHRDVGAASGLKMCFASLSKGFTALAIGSYTTAENLGVLERLKEELDAHSPGMRTRAEGGLVSMPPKAYRWVDEMREIAATFEVDGGFEGAESPFRAIAEIYELVANGTELGKEITGSRQQGKTADDVAQLMVRGMKRRKEKTD